MRVFIAINFNNQTKNYLEATIQGLKKHAYQGTFTNRDNLHLTLIFIGETNDIKSIISAMDKINHKKFVLHFKGVGRFRRDNGDIYWVGVDKCDELLNLHNDLKEKIVSAGFTIEEREYKPHMTLGRRILMRKSFVLQDFSEGILSKSEKVESISLMKSETINGHLVYKEIFHKKLH